MEMECTSIASRKTMLALFVYICVNLPRPQVGNQRGQLYEIFKSTPPAASEFVAAAFKPDSAWHRKEVEATLRQWFPFMAVSDDTRNTFQSEWTSRCFSLPADLQPDQLPPEKVMQMLELPAYTCAERNDATLTAPNPSARLESPVVNPTYGGAPGHRTQADVRREDRCPRIRRVRLVTPHLTAASDSHDPQPSGT